MITTRSLTVTLLLCTARAALSQKGDRWTAAPPSRSQNLQRRADHLRNDQQGPADIDNSFDVDDPSLDTQGYDTTTPDEQGYGAAEYDDSSMPQSPLWEELLQQQQEQAHRFQQTSDGAAADPRKSLFAKQISVKGLVFCYFIMLWRSINNWERASGSAPGSTSSPLLVVPAFMLMLANGACLGLTCVQGQLRHKYKMRMKAVLSADTLVELGMIIVNLLRAVFLMGKSTESMLSVSAVFTSVWFMMVALSFSKFHWV